MAAPTVKAIRIHETGGPEKLRLEDLEVGAPGPGEALVRHAAAGVNYVDVYHRSGLYPVPLPAVLGMEAAGTVEAVGPGVTAVKAGDRVAYLAATPGSYAGARRVPADRLLALPAGLDEVTAAATLLKGLTVRALVKRAYAVRPGDPVLVHAAAGGVGLLAVQWLKALGATVIGTAGTDEKAALARAHGCDHVIVYSREDFVARAKELTGGKGVAAVYDAVGKATFEKSLDCLRPLGTMVTFGNASGPVPPVDVLALSRRGSLTLVRPSVFHYVASRADLEAAAADLFDVLRSGKVKAGAVRRLPLAQAAEAHRALEARETTGSLVLVP
jgi:NADPH2:quinone reductase